MNDLKKFPHTTFPFRQHFSNDQDYYFFVLLQMLSPRYSRTQQQKHLRNRIHLPLFNNYIYMNPEFVNCYFNVFPRSITFCYSKKELVCQEPDFIEQEIVTLQKPVVYQWPVHHKKNKVVSIMKNHSFKTLYDNVFNLVAQLSFSQLLCSPKNVKTNEIISKLQPNVLFPLFPFKIEYSNPELKYNYITYRTKDDSFSITFEQDPFSALLFLNAFPSIPFIVQLRKTLLKHLQTMNQKQTKIVKDPLQYGIHHKIKQLASQFPEDKKLNKLATIKNLSKEVRQEMNDCVERLSREGKL